MQKQSLTAYKHKERKTESAVSLDCCGLASIAKRNIQEMCIVDAQSMKNACFRIALLIDIGELVQHVVCVMCDNKEIRCTQMLFDLVLIVQSCENQTLLRRRVRVLHGM